MDETDYKPTLLLDNGTGSVKAGPIEEDDDEPNPHPACSIRSCIAVPRCKPGLKMRVDEQPSEESFGAEAQRMRGVCTLEWPMQHGQIKDMDGMTKIWEYIIETDQQTTMDSSEDCEDYKGAFLTESPLLPRKLRGETMAVWFEYFHARSYFVAISALLGLYSTGRDDGIAIDSGDGVTHAVPVWQNYPIEHAIRRLPLAGRDLTEYMERMLIESDINLTTSAERMTAMMLKGNFEVQETSPDFTGTYVAMDLEEELKKGVEPQTFDMPDGSQVKISDQLVRVPELMFEPKHDGHEFGGIQHTVVNSHLACPIDCRKDLLQNLILMGGNTMPDGFKDRLSQEIEKIGVLSEIKVVANPDREIHPYQGGAMLAKGSNFSKFMIKKAEFEECGEDRVVMQRLVADKCAI